MSNEVDPREFYNLTKGLENRLLGRGLCTATSGGMVYVTQNEGLSSEEKVGNATFHLSSGPFIAAESQPLQEKLVQSALKIRARSLSFRGPEGGKFYRREPYKTDFWNYHHAFESSVNVFHDGRVGIWLDPTTRWTQRVSDYVQWARKSQKANNAIKDYLIGKFVYCPSVTKAKNFKAEIVDTIFEPINQHRIEVQGREYTVYDYWINGSPEYARWLARSKTRLNPDEDPVITVQIPGINARPSYPPSLLHLKIDLDDPDIPPEALGEKKILTPRQRIEATFGLYDDLLRDGLRINSEVSISFRRGLFEWTSPEGRGYSKTIPLPPPALTFGGGAICEPPAVWADPDIKNSLQKYGPVDKNEETEVDYVVPREFETRVKLLHSQLATRATTLKLGKYNLGKIEYVDRSHPDRYGRTCRNFGKAVKGVVVVVLPKELVSRAYYAAKTGLGEHETRSQMMRWNTASLLSEENPRAWGRGVDSIGFNIVAQIYDKSLGQGKSIWHLSSPAGGLDAQKTVYFMGFDVSRAPERRKEAAAYAAVCDSFGRILYRRSIDTHKGEKIQVKVLSDWFYDVASNSFDEVSSNKPVDELILFKDGPIPPNQIVDYKSGSEDAKDRLINEGVMTEGGNIRVLSVVKRGPYRVYGNDRDDYKTQNTAVILGPEQAIVVTSSTGRGTAAPVRIRFEYQLVEDMSIEQAIKIFNDLRYLDYTSLYKQPKTILPLHIVQNLAKLSKEDVNVPYVPR